MEKQPKKPDILSQISIDIDITEYAFLSDALIDILQGRKIGTANILTIVTQLMIRASHSRMLSGVQKKELVIAVLRNYICNSDIVQDVKDELLIMFEFVIPSLMDLLVSASKSRFVFKIKEQCCK
jgi:hypothetical protein